MSGNLSFYMRIVSTILFIILVFMNFLGYWTADRFVQILFFFSMITAVFSVGMETEKKLKNRSWLEYSNWLFLLHNIFRMRFYGILVIIHLLHLLLKWILPNPRQLLPLVPKSAHIPFWGMLLCCNQMRFLIRQNLAL